MKCTILLGRGVEGCGVTKFTIEQSKWFTKHSSEYAHEIFALKDKTWSRRTSHDTANFKLVRFDKGDDGYASVLKASDESDVLIINSLPPISSPPATIANFKKLLEHVKCKVVLIQHDHSMLSIRRNSCMDESIKRADLIFVHSVENDFAVYARQLLGVGGGLDAFFSGDEESPSTPIVGFQPGLYFDDIATKYWHPTKDANTHLWIGRTTSWKGYKEMFKFHEHFLKPHNQCTIFRGIERSPAYLGFRELAEFNDLIHEEFETYQFPATAFKGDNVFVFGPYEHTNMLKHMSRSQFGYQLSMLKPHFIERSIEYTHCEIPCLGTVPVFRKEYGDKCLHRYTGTPLTSHGADSGTVWLSESNFEEAWTLIDNLQRDYDMYLAYAARAYQFYRLHQDAEFTFTEMMGNINKYCS